MKLSHRDAAKAAHSKATALFSKVAAVSMTHANNRHLIYGKRLAEQVGQSQAANAFLNLQRASFGFELIRLMGLWDASRPERNSIPTIYKLIEPPEVRAILRSRYIELWRQDDPGEGHPDSPHFADFLERQGGMFDRQLRRLDRIIPAIQRSGRLKSLKGYRDYYLAHYLEPPAGYRSPRYGQERRLLLTTAKVANKLSVVITGGSFVFSAQQAISNGYADALWADCEFNIGV